MNIGQVVLIVLVIVGALWVYKKVRG